MPRWIHLDHLGGATRGRTVSPEAFASDLWNGVLCQFMVDDRDTGESLGLVVAYNPDAANGHCYFGVQRTTPESVPYGLLEACCMFISYMFANFAFRRLYAEILSHNEFLGASLVSLELAECVARYPEHQFGPLGYEDLFVFMITRDSWTSFATGLSSAIRAPLDASPKSQADDAEVELELRFGCRRHTRSD